MANSTSRSPLLLVAAVASAGAGLVHAAAAGGHGADRSLVWLFALTAVVQLAWAAAVVVRPTRRSLVAGVVLGVGAMGAWLLSGTIGIAPVGALAVPEPIGAQDALAAALALISAVAAGAAVLVLGAGRTGALPTPLAGVASLVVVALAVGGMVAPHAHGDAHATGDHQTSGDGHASGDGHGDGEAHPDADPVFRGVDVSGIPDDQLADAKSLVEETRAVVSASFSDVASVEAAGYRSIGDGRRATGVSYEHFVNSTYLVDGHELDPEHVESLVFEVEDGHKRLVTAMYVLGWGSTMDDVPEVAEGLTIWHDHQNLCWDESTRQLAGVLVDGRCTPGGTLRPTSPMLHVWLDEHPCGPFAGVEGHGRDEQVECPSSHAH